MKERNHGVDLLRILSILMVLTLHLMKALINNAEVARPNYYFAWTLEVFSYCAVNCYALISGFVGHGRKVKYSNLLYLCIQVSLYATIAYVVSVLVFAQPFSGLALIEAILPFSNWFIIAYFGMFFFSPFLNKFVEHAPKSMVKICLLTCTLLFSFLSVFLKNDLFGVSWGYSFVWLSFLYTFGAYVKKYQPFKNVKKRFFLLGYIVGALCLLAIKILEWVFAAHPFTGSALIAEFFPFFINYNSPIVLFNALCLLFFFSRLNVKGKVLKKLISIFSSVVFGVFLIHIQAPLRDPLMAWFGSFTLDAPLYMTILVSVGIILAEFLLCGLVDYIRKLLFDLCRVRKLCTLIEYLAKRLTYKFFLLLKIDLLEKQPSQDSVAEPTSTASTDEAQTNVTPPPSNDNLDN